MLNSIIQILEIYFNFFKFYIRQPFLSHILVSLVNKIVAIFTNHHYLYLDTIYKKTVKQKERALPARKIWLSSAKCRSSISRPRGYYLLFVLHIPWQFYGFHCFQIFEELRGFSYFTSTVLVPKNLIFLNEELFQANILSRFPLKNL